MTAVVFKAFESLKLSRNLTDDQLKVVLANPCTPSSDVSYEDGLTKILLAWLNAITGMFWRRAFEHSDREELQYGTIQLLDSNSEGNISITDLYDLNVDPTKLCTVLSEPTLFRFQLDVYKDNGSPDSQQTPATNPAPVNSAFDVLQRLKIRSKHHIFAMALSEHCIYAGRGGFITTVRNLPAELRHSTNEARATAILEVVCNPQSSISSAVIEAIEVEFCNELTPEE
jgi:hypothetical protein